MNIEDYFKINGSYEVIDGLINVTGNVKLIKQVDVLPCKFGVVTGNFRCSHNNLTSLTGAPNEVGGYFSCSYNNLTSLAGAPNTVGGDFYCDKHLHSTQEYKKYLILKTLRT